MAGSTFFNSATHRNSTRASSETSCGEMAVNLRVATLAMIFPSAGFSNERAILRLNKDAGGKADV